MEEISENMAPCLTIFILRPISPWWKNFPSLTLFRGGEVRCLHNTHTLGMMHWKALLTFNIMVISCVKHVSPHAKHIPKVDVFKTEFYPKKCLLWFGKRDKCHVDFQRRNLKIQFGTGVRRSKSPPMQTDISSSEL